jgi:hypothetical protein
MVDCRSAAVLLVFNVGEALAVGLVSRTAGSSFFQVHHNVVGDSGGLPLGMSH